MLTPAPVETPRLILRPESPADSAAIYAMNADPEVMRFVGDGTAWTSPAAEFAEFHRAALQRLADRNYGSASVFLKETGAFIGLCWLMPAPLLGGEIELGYRYVRSAWGKGYATEAARAVLTIAFERLGLPCVRAMAHPRNLASIRVLEKLGFQFQRDMVHPHTRLTVRIYEIARPAART